MTTATLPVLTRPTPWDTSRDAIIDLDIDGAARGAWQFIAAALIDWGMTDALDAVHHVTAELVTNALTHAIRPDGWHLLPLRIYRHRRYIAVEVLDADPGHMPARPHAGADDEHGRGLVIVDALCTALHAWSDHDAGLKIVRAHIPIPTKAATP